jgi:SAM-dependent methyltransferase
VELAAFYRWGDTNTSLRDVNYDLGIDLGVWVGKRHAETRKPVVILDWGCGRGRAITTLARLHGKKANCYGYGDQDYPQWRKNPRVKFIKNTYDRLLRYFPDASVDLIFSRLGLSHLVSVRHTKATITGPEFLDYIEKLSFKLKPGGVLVFSPTPLTSANEIKSIFQKHNLPFEVSERGVVTVRRK